MLFDRHLFFIKERVAVLKLADTYDILDPETQETVGVAKEEPASWAKALRLVVNKQMLPTKVSVYEDEDEAPLFTIRRPVSFFRRTVHICDSEGERIGYFKSKAISLGPSFRVFDADDNQVAEIKGDWKGWNFTFTAADGRELGKVTKKWAGIGKELFTSADNYLIALSDSEVSSPGAATLLLAAGLSVDMLYTEAK
jgi:uncharacterized protein YxjI